MDKSAGDQIYLSLVIWVQELMEKKYRILRQHMKFELPSDTRELLQNPDWRP